MTRLEKTTGDSSISIKTGNRRRIPGSYAREPNAQTIHIFPGDNKMHGHFGYPRQPTEYITSRKNCS